MPYKSIEKRNEHSRNYMREWTNKNRDKYRAGCNKRVLKHYAFKREVLRLSMILINESS
jgi:hypothetical protein